MNWLVNSLMINVIISHDIWNPIIEGKTNGSLGLTTLFQNDEDVMNDFMEEENEETEMEVNDDDANIDGDVDDMIKEKVNVTILTFALK